jgi:hypothetical protein
MTASGGDADVAGVGGVGASWATGADDRGIAILVGDLSEARSLFRARAAQAMTIVRAMAASQICAHTENERACGRVDGIVCDWGLAASGAAPVGAAWQEAWTVVRPAVS